MSAASGLAPCMTALDFPSLNNFTDAPISQLPSKDNGRTCREKKNPICRDKISQECSHFHETTTSTTTDPTMPLSPSNPQYSCLNEQLKFTSTSKSQLWTMTNSTKNWVDLEFSMELIHIVATTHGRNKIGRGGHGE